MPIFFVEGVAGFNGKVVMCRDDLVGSSGSIVGGPIYGV